MARLYESSTDYEENVTYAGDTLACVGYVFFVVGGRLVQPCHRQSSSRTGGAIQSVPS